ncbi:multicopper oxidase [Streptomyces sp. NL15-2K]|nr:multicopper oxidase [Streptomyces sp. NL15-2K]
MHGNRADSGHGTDEVPDGGSSLTRLPTRAPGPGPGQALCWERERTDAPAGELPADGIVQTPSGRPHPMHIHATSFRVRSRQTYDVGGFTSFNLPGGAIGCGTTNPLRRTGAAGVPPGERGWKDTVRVGAGELVTVDGYFGDAAGKFVYHCHMLEHEDMGMMRQFVVLPEQITRLGAPMDMPSAPGDGGMGTQAETHG